MSKIQRYDTEDDMYPMGGGDAIHATWREGEGLWVLYSDHEAALAEAENRQRAKDYVSMWARIMLEDDKYRYPLMRAALVIRGRLTDDDVLRLTGNVVRLPISEKRRRSKLDKVVSDERERIINALRHAADLTDMEPEDVSFSGAWLLKVINNMDISEEED